MCSAAAHTADTHRVSSLWWRTLKFCDSWPVINFHHYVLQCKLKQQCILQTLLSVVEKKKKITTSIQINDTSILWCKYSLETMWFTVNSFSFVGSSSGMLCVSQHGFILTKMNHNCLFSFLLFGLLVTADIAAFRTLQSATNLDGRVAEVLCGEQ